MAEIDMAAIMQKIREDKKKPQGGYIAKGFDEPVGDYETAVRLYRELKANPQPGKQIILVPSGGGMEYTEEAEEPRNAPSALPELIPALRDFKRMGKTGFMMDHEGNSEEQNNELQEYLRLKRMKLKEMGALDE